MKLSLKKAALTLLLGSIGTTSFSMQQPATEPAFDIFARNTLNRRVKVAWADREGTYQSMIIEPEKGKALMKFNDLQIGSTIQIEPYGDIVGWTAQKLTIPKYQLRVKWEELQTNPDDTLVLSISSSYLVYLDVNYAVRSVVEKVMAQKEKGEASNPLAVIAGLAYYPNIIAHLTDDKILRFEKWNDIVIPAQSRWQRPTMAEDVYRYILNLEPNYSAKNVKSAFKKMVVEYHSDKFPGRPEFADKIFKLLTKAKEGLLQALIDKEQAKEFLGEWVDLQPERAWQPDSPRKESPRKEEETSGQALVVVQSDEESL